MFAFLTRALTTHDSFLTLFFWNFSPSHRGKRERQKRNYRNKFMLMDTFNDTYEIGKKKKGKKDYDVRNFCWHFFLLVLVLMTSSVGLIRSSEQTSSVESCPWSHKVSIVLQIKLFWLSPFPLLAVKREAFLLSPLQAQQLAWWTTSRISWSMSNRLNPNTFRIKFFPFFLCTFLSSSSWRKTCLVIN